MNSPKNIYLRLKSKFTLTSSAVLEDTLNSLPENSTITFDGSNTNEFDEEALSYIHRIKENAIVKKIHVYFIKIPELVL